MSKYFSYSFLFSCLALCGSANALTLQVVTDPEHSHCTSVWALRAENSNENVQASKPIPDGVYKLLSNPVATCASGSFTILANYSYAVFYKGIATLQYLSDGVTCTLTGKDNGESLVSGTYACNNSNKYPLPWHAVVLPSNGDK